MSTSNETPFLVFGAPLIGEEEINEVIETLRSGWLGTGPKTRKFEADFADYKGVDPENVVAVSSCTSALYLSLHALNLQPDDEVITTPLTFCATINSIIHAGGKPVLADIDPRTNNIDPDAVARAITPKTRAILPVHLYGRPCDMQALRTVILNSGREIAIIEDCAHAIETICSGEKAGTMGDFGCFSFYPTKNLVTGEGGMIIGKKKEHVARARMLSGHGLSRDAWKRFGSSGYSHYSVEEPGFKMNFTDIQASLGIHQLAKLEKHWIRRAQIWSQYQSGLKGLPITLPEDFINTAQNRHAYHLYTVRIGSASGRMRDDILNELTTRKIGTGVHYQSMGEHKYYQDTYGWTPENQPYASAVGRETLSMPLSLRMTDADVDRVITAMRDIFR